MPRRSNPLVAPAGTVVLLASLLVGACTDPLVRARQQVVAEAGGSKLRGRELERFISSATGGHPDRNAALYTSLWIDFALLEAADRTGVALEDSATIAAAVWPDAAIAWGRRERERAGAAAQAATDARLAVLYREDRVRVFQQILVRLAFGVDTAVVSRATAKFKEVEARLRRGEKFDDVARAMSEDPSAERGGMMAAITKGTLAPQVERAGWPLPPGATSAPVRTGLGFHLIRRPTLAEARGPLLEFASRKVAPAKVDTIRIEPPVVVPDIVLTNGATGYFRTLMEEPGTMAGADTLLLAKIKGTPFTVAEGRRWIGAVPGHTRYGWLTAQDRPLATFLRELVAAEQVRRETKATVLTPEAWRELSAKYREGLVRARAALGPQAPTGGGSARIAAAAQRSLPGGRYHPVLPSGLGMVLRERIKVRVDQPAIAEIVKTVEMFRVPKDSGTAAP